MNTADDRTDRFVWQGGDITIRHPVEFPYRPCSAEAAMRRQKPIIENRGCWPGFR
jgi:hypothetical protein